MTQDSMVPDQLGDLAEVLGDRFTVTMVFTPQQDGSAHVLSAAVPVVLVDATTDDVETLRVYPGDLRDLNGEEQEDLLHAVQAGGLPVEVVPELQKVAGGTWDPTGERRVRRLTDLSVTQQGVSLSYSTLMGIGAAVGSFIVGAQLVSDPSLTNPLMLAGSAVFGGAGKVAPEATVRWRRARSRSKIEAYSETLERVQPIGRDADEAVMLRTLNTAVSDAHWAAAQLSTYGLDSSDALDSLTATAEAALLSLPETHELEETIREEADVVSRGTAAGTYDRDVEQVQRKLRRHEEELRSIAQKRQEASTRAQGIAERLTNEAAEASGRIDAARYDAGSGDDIERQLLGDDDSRKGTR